jgi:hypothetical protein
VLFKEHCDLYVKLVDRQIKHQVKTGAMVPIVQPDEKATPLKLRYEWAARRYCFT